MLSAGEAVALRLVGSHAGGSVKELVVVQGDKFDVHFDCVDDSGTTASSGISQHYRNTISIFHQIQVIYIYIIILLLFL